MDLEKIIDDLVYRKKQLPLDSGVHPRLSSALGPHVSEETSHRAGAALFYPISRSAAVSFLRIMSSLMRSS
jgi:hypothetical protein